MDDLVAFVRARLDDDEATAGKAASLCGCHTPRPRWRFRGDAADGRIEVEDDPHPDVGRRRISKRWNRTYDALFMAEHIARHDPARVLADVAAKRAILGDLRILLGGRPDDVNGLWTLKLLASVYADHPDFQETWRP